jgi:uncharacterized membrane-anchored protein YhcB (DUF1043 family)
MEALFQVISEKPEFFAWVFALVNVLWGAFLYFNKKRQEEELIRVKQQFDLDLERRKKVFEMKAGQYETYFKHIDAMHRKHQTDYQDVFAPIMNEFMASNLSASAAEDKMAATQATVRFSERVSVISRDGFEELMVIESETNSLHLTASDEVAGLLDEIQDLYRQLFAASGQMLGELVNFAINNDQLRAAEHQSQIFELGNRAKERAAALREAMRRDLKLI